MRFRFMFHKIGNCWKLFSFKKYEYYSGNMIVFSWWRFGLVFYKKEIRV